MVSFSTFAIFAASALAAQGASIPPAAKAAVPANAATPADAAADTKPPRWMTLPPTPQLPAPITTTTIKVNGVDLWLQKYNEKAGGTPIVLDHGGLGYSAYFGDVIKGLVANGHYVAAFDRRGHGRSTFKADDKFTFEMFAQDTDALLKKAGITKSIMVGWSDGAITTLAMLLDPKIAPSIEKAFLFGTTAVPSDTNATFSTTAMFANFVKRCGTEYATLQPNASFKTFAGKVATMEATLPQYGPEILAKIDGKKVTIAEGDHEEAVAKGVAARISKSIKGSKLVTLKDVSHFAPVQDPVGFTKAIEDFIKA
ncbi:alpha/beta hydrolase [Magnaporthiopsis poae ATCC 64411]|uniref:Alpha/beta hydrolase n=1 Tax=Magnaporthiopsis poae (strain ATCC 64411 / 73-15) TaxID=644358 RepID=A0A0C4E8A0_MAGP6|nr:alpha/beta hydrolase [Magnaporthiopsis poae ATCC 64411]